MEEEVRIRKKRSEGKKDGKKKREEVKTGTKEERWEGSSEGRKE